MPISGFPELLPNTQIAFNNMRNTIEQHFILHGFNPIDTPAVERVDTLLSKGNDNEIYGLYRLADPNQQKKELALRFDLTVPMARYVAEHYGQLIFPYKRYHIAPVWRGERPQSGRYRQFYQCDIDIIGDGELDKAYDAEVIAILCNVLKDLQVPNFLIKINNRQVLTGLLQGINVKEDLLADTIRILDKMDKITREDLYQQLKDLGLDQAQISILEQLINYQVQNNNETLDFLATLTEHADLLAGITDLRNLLFWLEAFSVDMQTVCITPTLARGLNYYTGMVCETVMLDHPEIGSIGGGGRYANLAASFINKSLPGVGLSIGISRLFPKLLELGVINATENTSATVLVTVQNRELLPYYLAVANYLRYYHIQTETFLADKTLGQQMKYASRKGFAWTVIANTEEMENQQVILRNMATGEQKTISWEDMLEMCK